MNKRANAIRDLLMKPPAELSDDNAPRAPAGPVRSMRDSFSQIELENEALRARLGAGEQVIEIDPQAVEPSPFADRFTHDDDPAFEALKASIAARGQAAPILVREISAGRYQAAYGHRRLRAAGQLGVKVKAIVRALSDDELVVAQGVENAAREDLSFIERALFALKLEEAGRSRALIGEALAVDKAEVSKLMSVARAVPREIAAAIGKAGRAGRPRWLAFAEALREPASLKRVRAAVAAQGFAALPPDERFARALAAAAKPAPRRRGGVLKVRDATGAEVASLSAAAREVRIALKNPHGERFAAYLARRMPRLLQEFGETESATD